MSAFTALAVAAALLQVSAMPGPQQRPALTPSPSATLSCRIKGADRVTFRVESRRLRDGPRKNARLHYADVRVTGIDRGRSHVDPGTLRAINAQLQTFRPLDGGTHVICNKRRAALVVVGWRGSDSVSLVLRAPAQGLKGFAVPPLQRDWTAH